MKTVFIRALDVNIDQKAEVKRAAIHAPGKAMQRTRFEVDPTSFSGVPKSPFVYWLPSRLLGIYSSLPPFENLELARETKCGLSTLDNFRFLRLRWETPNRTCLWKQYFSGGTFSPLYEDFWLLVNWGRTGHEIKTLVEAKVGSASRKVQAENYYFRPGFVFPRRTRGFCPKFMPAGGIFSTAGQAGFMKPGELAAGIGMLSSSVCSALLTVSQGTTPQDAGGTNPQFEVGQIKQLPWPTVSARAARQLDYLASRAWLLTRRLDTHYETSSAFVGPAVFKVGAESLSRRVSLWEVESYAIRGELAALRSRIDDRCFTLYCISDDDRRMIKRGFSSVDPEIPDETDTEDLPSTDPQPLVEHLLAWSIGVAFGRFDLRLATGERQPIEPEPFDPLPACSPGMLTGDDHLPLSTPPEGYPIAFHKDGVLVDDPGHTHDLTIAARAVFDVVFDDGDARWHEAAELIGARKYDLRRWFARDFFPLHIKTYSKSRRKAPIYWQLATPSASYSMWVYYHRFTPDTLFRVHDLSDLKLQHEESKLNELIREAGGDPSRDQRAAIDSQETFVTELRAFEDEVDRVKRLWNPDLNDGVILNFAPLWRLVPQHKPWQREVKKIWDQLVAGDYDWAHLAMHLWPERVVPKCQDDRSLAIAHGLEEDFWIEDDAGKWQQREISAEKVEALVAERTSSAVKAALDDLLSAPAPSRSTGRHKSARRKRQTNP